MLEMFECLMLCIYVRIWYKSADQNCIYIVLP